MRKIKEQELKLLTKVCKENEIPLKMVKELLNSAEKFSYENSSPASRRKEYIDLIDFFSKTNKGD